MITTLISFSIVSIICIGCIGIINSNNEIIDINYKSTIVKYKLKGGLELVYSKVLEEVNNTIEKSKISENPQSYFKNYFLIDNKNNFIYKIENINLDDIEVYVVNDKVYMENNHIRFDITCSNKTNNIKKSYKSSFKIKTDFDFNNNTDLNEIVIKYNAQEI